MVMVNLPILSSYMRKIHGWEIGLDSGADKESLLALLISFSSMMRSIGSMESKGQTTSSHEGIELVSYEGLALGVLGTPPGTAKESRV